jgi:hypothetical protein
MSYILLVDTIIIIRFFFSLKTDFNITRRATYSSVDGNTYYVQYIRFFISTEIFQSKLDDYFILLDTIYLSGGDHPYQGTIHLKHNNVWGSVCDDAFDVNDAKVVCRMLGYNTL